MRTISAVWSSWGPSPQLRTFSHALNMYRRRTLTGWKFNKSGVLVEHQLIFSSFYWRGVPPTPPAEGKMENWCSDNFHNLLFFLFTEPTLSALDRGVVNVLNTIVWTLSTLKGEGPLRTHPLRFWQLLALAKVKVGGVPGLSPPCALVLQGVGRPPRDHVSGTRC